MGSVGSMGNMHSGQKREHPQSKKRNKHRVVLRNRPETIASMVSIEHWQYMRNLLRMRTCTMGGTGNMRSGQYWQHPQRTLCEHLLWAVLP
jgi:hypothetical protein